MVIVESRIPPKKCALRLTTPASLSYTLPEV